MHDIKLIIPVKLFWYKTPVYIVHVILSAVKFKTKMIDYVSMLRILPFSNILF